jgi:hypothetical protein
LAGSTITLHRGRIDKVLEEISRYEEVSFQPWLGPKVNGRVSFRLEFGSYRAQAEGAWHLFKKYFERDGTLISFDCDSCDRVENLPWVLN